MSGWTRVISGHLEYRKSVDGHIKVKRACLEREFTNSQPSGGLNVLCWLKGQESERKPEAGNSEGKVEAEKGCGRPIRKAGTEKVWEAKVVWEVSKESRGQKVEAGKV